MVSALIGTGSPQYVYGYDHASNLLSITPNGTTQTFSYTSTNAITSSTYDANGSPTVLSGKSYKWDGVNRIVRFANTANNTGSSFTYDGLGRLVRVVDTHAGAITADHSYTWCGSVRCLAHDNTQSGSPVSTQYFDQGAIIGATSYYYVKDKLGSVTELVSGSGSVASQYTYDPYGNQGTVSGTLVSDIGYAGYFYHAVSGLDFTLHRAYDPTHARWLNRDPIGELGGVNLYAYVGGSPASRIDPLGLCFRDDLKHWGDKLLDLEFFLWGGYSNFVSALQQTGWPGGSWDASLAALPPIGAVEGAAAEEATAAAPIIEGELQFAEQYLANMARDSGLYHAFPTLVAQEVLSTEGQVINANYTLYTLQGSINVTKGVYEIGVNASGQISHYFFNPF